MRIAGWNREPTATRQPASRLEEAVFQKLEHSDFEIVLVLRSEVASLLRRVASDFEIRYSDFMVAVPWGASPTTTGAASSRRPSSKRRSDS